MEGHDTELSRRIERPLRAMLQRLTASRGVHNAVLAVQAGDGAFRWRGAEGAARPDGSPMTPDTPYHIASIDKLFTAALVMKLHESGRLGLDDGIVSHLPEELTRGLHRMRGIDHTDRITIRNLLAHTSGLADCYEDRPRRGPSSMESLFEGGDSEWTVEDLARRVRDELSPHFPPQPSAPGKQKVRYSDTNYQLLIAIVESVTRMPIHAVLDQMLFRPLELRRTWMFGRCAPTEATPEPSSIWYGDRPLDIPLALRSFPSVYSTADDQLRFILALVRGDVFDRRETLALMCERWNRFALPRDAAALRAPSWPIEYGLGIMRFRLPRPLSGLHSMPAVIGHTGSTGSWLFYCEELDLALAGTVNQATAGATPYRVVPKLLREWEAAARPR